MQADVKFLRRVLLGLVVLTLFTGGAAAVATVQAKTEVTGQCVVFCND